MSEQNNTNLDHTQDNAASVDGEGGDAIDQTDIEPPYILSFQSRRHLMPHWRNVLAPSRGFNRGMISLNSFFRPPEESGSGLALEGELRLEAQGMTPTSLMEALGPSSAYQQRADIKAILVSDLSERLINSIGPVLHLSPEAFEEHLVKSGYTPASYEDPGSSTWPTRFLQKQQVSLRWHSLVRREDVEPRNEDHRRQLLTRGLSWDRAFPAEQRGKVRWRDRYLVTKTNIFRQEWPLSVVYRPLQSRLVQDGMTGGLIDVGEGDELTEWYMLNRRPESEMDIVAWEECVTFCWGQWGSRRVRK